MAEFRIPDEAQRQLDSLPRQEDLLREEPGLSDPDAPTLGRFHSEPRSVEVAAALKVWPKTGTQRRLILDAIVIAGDRGLTHDEIAQVPGVSDRAHRTRRKELEDGGWVVDSGRTRKTVTETDAVVWILSDAGKRCLMITPAPPTATVSGYSGFVCWACGAHVDDKNRGPHVPGCKNEWKNEGLQPWRLGDG